MSIEAWIERLKQGGEHETNPQASLEEIRQEEAALGIKLPPSYQAFLSQFSNGAYLYQKQEVAAVTALKDLYPPEVMQDLCADEPIKFREGGDAPLSALYPFSLDSNGNAWCFVVGEGFADDEYPVAYLDYHNPKLYARLSGFSEWLGISHSVRSAPSGKCDVERLPSEPVRIHERLLQRLE